jgi:hypothetical protein
VIDDNPSPLAAHIVLGPLADPREIATRVRIDDYTYLHAIAQTADGRLRDGTTSSSLLTSVGTLSTSDEPVLRGMQHPPPPVRGYFRQDRTTTSQRQSSGAVNAGGRGYKKVGINPTH